MAERMDITQLSAVIKNERQAAMGGDADSGTGSDLAKQQSESMDYFLGDMGKYMPTKPGRSKVVSTDVADTVEAIMPSLMDIFTGSEEIARFSAENEEDEPAAKQETDYVNHVFYQENDGFMTLYTAFKDALVQKNGVIKYWYEEKEDIERETYYDLTADAYALLEADDETEVIEKSENVEEITEGLLTRLQTNTDTLADVASIVQSGGQQVTLYDATVKKTTPASGVRFAALAPEEFLIAKGARTIDEASYCGHDYKATRSDLIAEGFDETQVMDLPAYTDNDTGMVSQSRNTVQDSSDRSETANRMMEEIAVTENYIRVDYDGDGLAELRKVTTATDSYTILERDGEPDNEEYDRMPFVSLTPIPQPHRFYGRSLADITMEIQKINTALWRHLLDNIYFSNSQRLYIAEDLANKNTMEDALTLRPGQPIRGDQPGAVTPIPTDSIAGQILPVLEYTDVKRETRTGVSRNTVGPGATDLNPFNNTATGANIMANMGHQRIRLIARIFAETGLTDLLTGIRELLAKHGAEAQTVKLNNEWVTVNPRDWTKKRDMTVMLPLGAGTRDQMSIYLERILERQIQTIQMQGSVSGPLVTLENIYNTLSRQIENAGFNDASPFFEAVDMESIKRQEKAAKEQQGQQQDPAVMEVQRRAQRDQAEIGLKAQDQQTDQAVEAAKIQQDQAHNVASLEEKRFEAVLKSQTDMFEAKLDATTDRLIAQMEARNDAQIAELRNQWEAFVAMSTQDIPEFGGDVGK